MSSPAHGSPDGAVSAGTPPQRDPQSLTLTELRAYRQHLTAEEDKVSYWRRLAHARIDVLDAGAHTEGNLSFDELVRALGDTGTGQTRGYLASVGAAEPLPDLPDLALMWTREVDLHDPEQVADALERIHAALEQLTVYRQALHSRIDEASAELIRRYRQDPLLALSILPD
jgi:hypothetical protein|nr:hypothetical protein [Aeromicrobium sp.]